MSSGGCSTPLPPPLLNSDMERYEVLKDIGSGNFGVSKLVRDKRTWELFAVKLIERGPKIDENVQREIINHRSLKHPNIIRFKEVLLTPSHLAIVMEYAAGGEMFARISSGGRFSEDEARFFFQQLISGVSYCHSKQICHRDLKLENTLLDGSAAPRLKICDFGYSKSSVLHSQPKSTVGTPAYIAPEVLSSGEYDGKRILIVQYSIPTNVPVSSQCVDLLSRIFVADPGKRITVQEIKNHPWFLANLPTELTDWHQITVLQSDDTGEPLQSVEDITAIIQEAKKPVGRIQFKASHFAEGSMDFDGSIDFDDLDEDSEVDDFLDMSGEFTCDL